MSNLNDRESDIGFPEQYDVVKMRPLPPKVPHWFYEREDGTIIDVGEQEAAQIEKDANRARKLRRYGFSDGSACIEFLRNCGYRPGQQVTYELAKKIQTDAYEAELVAAKGKWRRPHLKTAHFDSSITNHQNAEGIMRSFGI